MKIFFLFFVSLILMFGSGHEYKAFLTSHEFQIEGILYSFDFNGNGDIEHDEYLYLKENRLYHTDLAKGYPLFLTPIELDLHRAKLLGYVAIYKTERIFLSKRGRVYKFLTKKRFFDPLEKDLTFEIDNDKAAIVYRDLKDFKTIIAHYDTPGFAWSLIADGDRIIIADGKDGLLALDYINGKLEPAWSYKSCGEVFAAAKIAKGLYTVGTDNGLEVVEEGKGSAQKRMFKGDRVSKVVRYQGKIYFLVEDRGIFVLDKKLRAVSLSNLQNPQDFCVAGDTLYIADAREGVVKISKQKRIIVQRSDIKSLALYKKRFLLLLPWQSRELIVYDTESDRTGTISVPDQIGFVKVLGDFFYLLHKNAEMSQWTMNSIENVKKIQTIYLPYPSLNIVRVNKEYLGVADGGFGVLLLNREGQKPY